MAKKIKQSGVRPEPANGLETWQKNNGDFEQYPVVPVDETTPYKSRKGGGITHIDDEGKKHAWSLGALSAEADKGKVQFLNDDGEPAKVGAPYKLIELPNKMGRDEQGSMLT